jgi:tetratricopeptide (TPR) repeat protein
MGDVRRWEATVVGEAGWLERAQSSYERAVFDGDLTPLADAERELDEVEADVALARGRILHARFIADRRKDPEELPLFERAAELYRRLGDVRGEGESLFWVGVFHQVVLADGDAAVPFLERSYELAGRAADKMTLSYAARHLGFASAAAGDLSVARGRLEESVRLRREVGYMPAVAAGLLALAQVEARDGDRDAALGLLDEAGAVAEACQARRIIDWVAQARADL